MRNGLSALLVVFLLLLVMLGLLLLVVAPQAHAACQSLQQARRHNPNSHLTWHGNHCWTSGQSRHTYHRIRPSQRAREDTVSIPVSEGSNPSTATTTPDVTPLAIPVPPVPAVLPAVDQVLTEGSLIIHGVERLPLIEKPPLAYRLDDSSKQIDTAVVQWQSYQQPVWRDRMLRALGVVLFVSVVLAIIVKIIGSMMYRLQKLT